MSQFKKGQIVYVSTDGVNWNVSHYMCTELNGFITNDTLENSAYELWWKHCLSVEDYQKMKNTPKDKDLVWAWDDWTSCRDCRFYDAKYNRTFGTDASRNGSRYSNYKVIKKEDWPEWALEEYDKLED